MLCKLAYITAIYVGTLSPHVGTTVHAWFLAFPLAQNAKTKRESIGVELYGFQQNLAKLQLALEQTHQNYQVISKMRTQVRHTGHLLSMARPLCMAVPLQAGFIPMSAMLPIITTDSHAAVLC